MISVQAAACKVELENSVNNPRMLVKSTGSWYNMVRTLEKVFNLIDIRTAMRRMEDYDGYENYCSQST